MTASEKKKIINNIIKRINTFYEPQIELDIMSSGARLVINNGSTDISSRLKINDMYNYMSGFDDALTLIEPVELKRKK